MNAFLGQQTKTASTLRPDAPGRIGHTSRISQGSCTSNVKDVCTDIRCALASGYSMGEFLMIEGDGWGGRDAMFRV